MTVVRQPKFLARWSVTLVDRVPRADACWTPVPSIHDVVLQLANTVLGQLLGQGSLQGVHRPHPHAAICSRVALVAWEGAWSCTM
jgi:hypothetical protein